MKLTAPQHRRRGHVPLRAFTRLDRWWLASAGIEAQRAISVGRAKLTVYYKVHVIPSRRITYKASITVWPNARRRLASPRQPGWHRDLAKDELVSGMFARTAPIWVTAGGGDGVPGAASATSGNRSKITALWRGKHTGLNVCETDSVSRTDCRTLALNGRGEHRELRSAEARC
jgi:hypothetical protein